VPYQGESSYFVRLDAPPPTTGRTAFGHEREWDDHGSASPPPKRRRKKFRIRPVGLLLLLVVGWVAWAYTTPGGPSARIDDWIDQTRGVVNNASVGPGLGQTASYFNQLYVTQGSYPDMSQTQIQEDPNAGMGLSTNFVWCNGHAVVLQDLSAGGSVSRLLVNGVDLGQVPGSQGCPVNLAHPAPWKLKKPKPSAS
jgi:hypothetical protein